MWERVGRGGIQSGAEDPTVRNAGKLLRGMSWCLYFLFSPERAERGCKQKLTGSIRLWNSRRRLVLLVWTMAGDQGLWRGIEGWVFTSFLIVLFVYDLRYGLIPDHDLSGNGGCRCFFLAAHFTLCLLPTGYSLFWLAAVFALQYYSSRGRWVGTAISDLARSWAPCLAGPGARGAFGLLFIGGAVGADYFWLAKTFGQTLPWGHFSLLELLSQCYGESRYTVVLAARDSFFVIARSMRRSNPVSC